MRHHTAENNFFEKVLSAKYNNGVEKKESSNRKNLFQTTSIIAPYKFVSRTFFLYLGINKEFP